MLPCFLRGKVLKDRINICAAWCFKRELPFIISFICLYFCCRGRETETNLALCFESPERGPCGQDLNAAHSLYCVVSCCLVLSLIAFPGSRIARGTEAPWVTLVSCINANPSEDRGPGAGKTGIAGWYKTVREISVAALARGGTG